MAKGKRPASTAQPDTIAVAKLMDYLKSKGYKQLALIADSNTFGQSGVKALQAYASPYSHTGVKFIPLGGINMTNAAAYLALPVVGAIGGSWIAEKKLVRGQQWDEIIRRTAEVLKLAHGK